MNDTTENALETALRLAADDPARRPDFYTLLLTSSIHVIGQTDTPDASGGKVMIQSWQHKSGGTFVPFFTSLSALQRAIREQVSYLSLPARELFEMTKGEALILNPGSPYGKEFLAREIESMLATGMNRVPAPRVTEQETQVMLGQPAKYPVAMVEALGRFFAGHTNVKAAYLALMHDPSHDEKPHLIIGVEADGDFDQIARETGSVTADTAPTGGPVDLYRVEADKEGLSTYFLDEVKPFYTRN